jgi:hypothetical protein
VKSDSTLACWGNNDYGQSTPPAGTFVQISAGEYHTCGVKSDGVLACWGRTNYGQSTPPAGNFVQISAGNYHTCGVKSDGTLACWGYNGTGQATPPTGTFVQISAGYWHTCGVRSDGTYNCWGSDSNFQLNPRTFIPIMFNDFFSYYEGPNETESNNNIAQSNGPLRLNQDYYGYPNDTYDFYSIRLRSGASLTITLTNFTGSSGQLQLYDQSQSLVAYDTQPPYQINYSAGAGDYYIMVYTGGGWNSSNLYTLRVSSP